MIQKVKESDCDSSWTSSLEFLTSACERDSSNDGSSSFENLFSLIRRAYKKSNVSYADKLHLHQLVFRYLKTNKIFNEKIINPITALIILLFNLPSFIIASLLFSHTKSLIFILLINLTIYLSAYYFLSKNFKFKK